MVYILSYDKMSDTERALALSLQGVINRQEQTVFIDVDHYIDYVKDEDRQCADVYSLIETYKPLFEGAVVYDLDEGDAGINMAATISAAYNVLGVPRALAAAVSASGIKILYDLADIEGSNILRQRSVFDYCYPRLQKNGLVHQVTKKGNFHIRLRDLSIANGWACIYTDESAEGRTFRKYVLEKLDKNIPIYGWNDDEIAFIKDISTYGDFALPTDWSCNHSYFKQSGGALRQSRFKKQVRKHKHYVALVVSDGDNIQWLERDFSTERGSYGQRLHSGKDYKMTWTISPSLMKICPDGARYIYDNAGWDYFISSVSGIGYANCLSYPRERLDEFTRLTAEAMQSADLSIVCLLDNVKNIQKLDIVADRLHSYTRFDTILGGIWELDPDRYGSGGGKIYWSDGKPFVSVRYTLWYPTNDPKDVNNEWLGGIAREVNSMPICPRAESGYSVINVHPWTMTQKTIDKFVSMLDLNRIELVYADELIDMVKNNVLKKE